ncbi:hypothetical protein GGR57DRAFT_480146 [Xylariaceae sp. FL1272]|nr:hypothetical protein GGR57DRAFT_480146 [Xylariaceae sp. FL1272]
MRALISEDSRPPIPPPVRANLAETLPPDNLDPEHLETFTLALTNLLRSDVTESTFAQILDGFPTLSSFGQSHFVELSSDHPLTGHESLCPGAVEKMREFRSTFDIRCLRFSPMALQGFQNEIPSSRSFHFRLIELLAVACHQIAAFLFQADESNQHRKAYEAWASKWNELKTTGDEGYILEDMKPPTVFYHDSYCDHEQYPRAVPDVVGYWAEAKIFGGVVLFERGESETGCNNIWLDPNHRPGPTTMYSPTPEQFNTLVQFLLSDRSSTTECPLPIRASNLNRPRFYRYHATKYFHIFRDKYDSRLPAWFLDTSGCARNPRDFPELEDEHKLLDLTMSAYQSGTQPDDHAVAAIKESLKNITPSSPLWPIDDPRFK